MLTEKGQALYEKARRLIPGGTQLLSKRPEMFAPGIWPPYYRRASGTQIEDVDGNIYTDMSYAGIGTCVLGYADPDVDAAVQAAVASGSMSTLNCPEEVALAELLCALHPWAEMARFARSGGEALSIAVRLARAATGRDVIVFCGYHGWSDWYLAANLASDSLSGHLIPGLSARGVPEGLSGTAFPFAYNRLDQLDVAIAAHRGRIAAVLMEPRRRLTPEPGFLEGVRDRVHREGALLIFDEVTAGWRMNTGGIHLTLGVDPDIAVFAKAMSNGYPMAAIIGRASAMQSAQDSFISSTYWTERLGPVAALATIQKHQRINAPSLLNRAGGAVQAGWKRAAAKAGVPIAVAGIAPLSFFSIDLPQAQELRTLFTILMLERGFLATNAFYATCAHQDEHIRNYLAAAEEVFFELRRAAERGVSSVLRTPAAHAGFSRLA